jgi:hypothetical protein
LTPHRRGGQPNRARSRVVRRELLVFTEGEKTEEGYLIHWWRAHRDQVTVTIDAFHGGPLPLVDRAAAAKRAEADEERRGRGRSHDEVWCVFDRDEHPNIPQALEKARANGISVALSNPCIELWFLLHFEDQTGHLERDEAQIRSKTLLGCEKTVTSTALRELEARYGEARARARKLDKKHRGDGSPRHSNPSSNLWELIDRILTPALA